MVIDSTYLKWLRRLGVVEGSSTLILFGIAMPLKYYADQPLAVQIVGPLHGLLFVALCIMCVVAIRRVPVSFGLALAGILSAVVPFGPFVIDRWWKRLEGPNA